MNFFGLTGKLLIRRAEAIEEIIACAKPGTGYLIGFISMYSALLLKLLTKLSSGFDIKSGVFIQLPILAIKAAALLYIYGAIVFGLGRLLKGTGSILKFIPFWGWTLMPSILLSITLVPFATASKLVLFSHSISTIFIFCGILAVAEFVWEVLLGVEMLMQAMQLGKGQAYLIYFVSFILYTIISILF